MQYLKENLINEEREYVAENQFKNSRTAALSLCCARAIGVCVKYVARHADTRASIRMSHGREPQIISKPKSNKIIIYISENVIM